MDNASRSHIFMFKIKEIRSISSTAVDYNKGRGFKRILSIAWETEIFYIYIYTS
jgi:hypothetical protein